MTYRLFIDDERDPVNNLWLIARSSYDAMNAFLVFGMPLEIAFDHDLGEDDTSMVYVKWLYDRIVDDGARFPEGFTYSVHSQNPVGAANIKSLMDSLIEYCEDHKNEI